MADCGELAQTTFCFDPSSPDWLQMSHFNSEPGGYEPSQEDDRFTPFYPDPSQRVLVVEPHYVIGFFAVRTERLLMLARERKGENLQWGEWKAHTTWVSCKLESPLYWVSGPLVFSVTPTQSHQRTMEVYDFSAKAYAMSTRMIKDGTNEQFEPSIRQILPRWDGWVAASYGCHNSITFLLVKPTCLLNPTQN